MLSSKDTRQLPELRDCADVLSGLVAAAAGTGAGLVTGGEIRRIEQEEDVDNGFE